MGFNADNEASEDQTRVVYLQDLKYYLSL